jgi:hypothetical protein
MTNETVAFKALDSLKARTKVGDFAKSWRKATEEEKLFRLTELLDVIDEVRGGSQPPTKETIHSDGTRKPLRPPKDDAWMGGDLSPAEIEAERRKDAENTPASPISRQIEWLTKSFARVPVNAAGKRELRIPDGLPISGMTEAMGLCGMGQNGEIVARPPHFFLVV